MKLCRLQYVCYFKETCSAGRTRDICFCRLLIDEESEYREGWVNGGKKFRLQVPLPAVDFCQVRWVSRNVWCAVSHVGIAHAVVTSDVTRQIELQMCH